MTPSDFRFLCAGLLDGLDCNRHPEVRYPGHLRTLMAKARAALAQPAEAASNTTNPWKDAVIEVLVVNFIYKKEHESSPLQALADLVQWEVDSSKDPLINPPVEAPTVDELAEIIYREAVYTPLEQFGYPTWEELGECLIKQCAQIAAHTILARFGNPPPAP